MDNIRAQFYFFIGNFVEFSYKEIKPSGQERTAAEWDSFLIPFLLYNRAQF